MINIDTLLKKDAFKGVSAEQAGLLRELAHKLDGKSALEAMPVLMDYSKKAQKYNKFTKEEGNAMLEVFVESVPENERTPLLGMLKIFDIFSEK